MDGREDMGMPSYYIHRGIGGGMRSISNQSSGMAGQNSAADVFGGGSAVESSPPSISHHGVAGGVSQVEPPAKRKRGRPRKYGVAGTTALAMTPMSSTPPSVSVMGSITSSSIATEKKRGRGRPPGTGRKQQLASLGEWVSGSAGMAFTPHILTISTGEDIAAKILSFTQQGPRAVCVLSANGAASTVTLCQPATSGGTVTYEGRFEILSLSGCFLISDEGGSHSHSGGFSISLSSPDGRVIGGGIGGPLIAASNAQVMMGSFIYGGSKTKNKNKTSQESGANSELNMGMKSMPSSALASPNLTSSSMGGWPSSRQMEMRNSHMQIDLTRG